MKFKKLLYVGCLTILVSLSSCSVILGSTTGTNSTNNITNKVTVGEITIGDLEDAVTVAYEKVQDSCIGITRKFDAIDSTTGISYQQPDATGSGVIYKRIPNYDIDGVTIKNYTYYVVTNRHVAVGTDKKTYHLYAYFGDEELQVEMKLLGYDPKIDIACATFEHYLYFETVEFADVNELKAGSFAFAVGCPEGFDYYNSITFGVISSPRRHLSDDTDGDGVNDFNYEYIQHDVSINPGNSGGGLFNIEGKLIGINTMKLVSSDIDNMGFSIPADIVYTLLNDYLEENKPIVRARLGVSGFEVRDLEDAVIIANNLKPLPNIYEGKAPYGFYVQEVVSGGSIYGSGITVHDIILMIDDIKLYNMYTISSKLNSLVDYKIGDTVKVTYYDRSSDSVKEVNVVLKNN